MLTKEEFKKELVRMWDSVREEYKGVHNCAGIEFCEECPLHKCCCDKVNDDHIYKAFEIIDAVEQWSKEHPIITNKDKFKEVFGVDMSIQNDCGGIDCPRPIKCEECEYRGFWSREYKEPKESEIRDDR